MVDRDACVDEGQCVTNLDGRRVVTIGASSGIGELAPAYVFLMTATSMTGATLPVPGGLSLDG